MSSTIIETFDKIKDYDKSKYISMPFMTKYEFNLLIGLRIMHLSRGAKVFVDIPSDYKIKTNMDLRNIAIQELKEKKLPYIIKRKMPNNKYEYWSVDELSLVVIEQLIDEIA